MNFDVVVVGELNVDLLLNGIQSFPSIGSEILADHMKLALGSSSAIFASNISTLGARVKFIGKVGDDDFGEFCINCLKQKNIDVASIRKDTGSGTGLTVVMNYGEDRAMVTYQGAMKSFSLNDIDFNDLKDVKHLHFASIFLQPAIAPQIHTLFKKAKEMGLTVSFDTQYDPSNKWDVDLKSVLPLVDVFLPNISEFKALTRTDDWQQGMMNYKDYANIIAMKAGQKGSYVFQNNNIKHCEPFLNENVVDAIGAGDSFNAGFIYQFVQGASLEECQTFGNLMGAINTTAAGGTSAFISKKNIIEFAKQRFNISINL
jgi:sugar/nucleoside kinase (ribokinase family)